MKRRRKKEKSRGKLAAYTLVGQLLKVPETGKVLDGPELGTTSIDTLVYVAHTITGVIPSGHVLSCEPLGRVATMSKVALPPSTLTVCVSVTVVVVFFLDLMVEFQQLHD